ncbi:MAG: tetratricopeptide repeat protein, partial [Acetobacteraceae bacterium]|nr:tetratricopeptide repeat protein [Acetobacteraceae bacterium]
MQLSGRVEAVVDGVLRGWAWDAARPGLRLAVAVLADGRRIATCRADRPRGDLRRNGIGDGAHGLECPLPLELLDGAEHDFVLAADGDPAPAEIARGRLAVPRQGHLLHGRLERIEPRRVTGWVADRARPGTPVPVELVAGGAVVARTLADRFRRDLLEAGIGSGAHGFVFELGEEVAALPPGTEILVRAGSDFGHWELARRRLAHPAGVADEAREGAAQALRPLLEEARAAERRGELRRAAGLLDEALALAPGEFETLAIRARVAFALGAAEDAGRFARAALALRPGHVRPTVILARLASARGDHAEAAELWSAEPAGDSCYRERLVKRGRALAALGRPREAMAEFGAALALDPDDRDALRGQAQLAEG